MNIKREQEGDVDILIVVGEIDAVSSVDLDTSISESVGKGYKKILVDCSALEYISSAGLGVFMSYIEDFKIEGIHMVLFGLNESVANTFNILGLTALLCIRNTKEEAKCFINELPI